MIGMHVEKGFSSGIISRYADFGANISSEAEMLYLENQVYAPPKATEYETNITNITHINNVIEQNPMVNVKLDLSFTDKMITEAVTNIANTYTRHGMMLERPAIIKKDGGRVYVDKSETNKLFQTITEAAPAGRPASAIQVINETKNLLASPVSEAERILLKETEKDSEKQTLRETRSFEHERESTKRQVTEETLRLEHQKESLITRQREIEKEIVRLEHLKETEKTENIRERESRQRELRALLERKEKLEHETERLTKSIQHTESRTAFSPAEIVLGESAAQTEDGGIQPAETKNAKNVRSADNAKESETPDITERDTMPRERRGEKPEPERGRTETIYESISEPAQRTAPAVPGAEIILPAGERREAEREQLGEGPAEQKHPQQSAHRDTEDGGERAPEAEETRSIRGEHKPAKMELPRTERRGQPQENEAAEARDEFKDRAAARRANMESEKAGDAHIQETGRPAPLTPETPRRAKIEYARSSDDRENEDSGSLRRQPVQAAAKAPEQASPAEMVIPKKQEATGDISSSNFDDFIQNTQKGVRRTAARARDMTEELFESVAQQQQQALPPRLQQFPARSQRRLLKIQQPESAPAARMIPSSLRGSAQLVQRPRPAEKRGSQSSATASESSAMPQARSVPRREAFKPTAVDMSHRRPMSVDDIYAQQGPVETPTVEYSRRPVKREAEPMTATSLIHRAGTPAQMEQMLAAAGIETVRKEKKQSKTTVTEKKEVHEAINAPGKNKPKQPELTQAMVEEAVDINRITDKVYKALEARIRSERIRRGL